MVHDSSLSISYDGLVLFLLLQIYTLFFILHTINVYWINIFTLKFNILIYFILNYFPLFLLLIKLLCFTLLCFATSYCSQLCMDVQFTVLPGAWHWVIKDVSKYYIRDKSYVPNSLDESGLKKTYQPAKVVCAW